MGNVPQKENIRHVGAAPADSFVNNNSSFYSTWHFTKHLDMHITKEGLQKNRLCLIVVRVERNEWLVVVVVE